ERSPWSVSTMRGTPMRSSGASWVPSRLTHSIPSSSANSPTSVLLPMPGGPQMNTGRATATWSSVSARRAGVTVTEACTPAILPEPLRGGRRVAGAADPVPLPRTARRARDEAVGSRPPWVPPGSTGRAGDVELGEGVEGQRATGAAERRVPEPEVLGVGPDDL